MSKILLLFSWNNSSLEILLGKENIIDIREKRVNFGSDNNGNVVDLDVKFTSIGDKRR